MLLEKFCWIVGTIYGCIVLMLLMPIWFLGILNEYFGEERLRKMISRIFNIRKTNNKD